MQGTRRGAGRFRVVAAAGGLLLALAVGSPASAAGLVKERFEYPLESQGTVDCGTYQDNFVDSYQVTEIDVYDAAHNLLRVEYHAAHTSVDRNSVTGVTLEEHGHFYQVEDYVARTITITGNQEVANRPGKGVVIQDVGRLVFSMDTEDLVFFGGGRNHSQVILGDGIWCDALS